MEIYENRKSENLDIEGNVNFDFETKKQQGKKQKQKAKKSLAEPSLRQVKFSPLDFASKGGHFACEMLVFPVGKTGGKK